VSAIFASRITNCARQITCVMTAFVSINSSNQRFFLKFAKHAQSVRCIFCNYCANILRFCFLSRVFLLRWPIIRTCGIQKRLKLRSLLLSADGKWWRCSRLTSSWLHFRARACGPSGIFSILCYEYEIRDLSICIRDYVPASAIVITSSTLKYLTFLNIHASLALLSENNFYVRAPSVWNILLSKIRDTSRSLAYFKSSLLNYYLEQIYNPDNPRTFKSVCVKCHSIRSLDSLFNSEDMLLTF
jgi:hypothetical protein